MNRNKINNAKALPIENSVQVLGRRQFWFCLSQQNLAIIFSLVFTSLSEHFFFCFSYQK